MPDLVEHLAELTGFRDRDVLDTTLAGALRDLLCPLEVAIYRSVGEVGDERWLTRARLACGDVAATADAAWTELDQLPAVGEHPQRLECLVCATVTEVHGQPHTTIFPLTTDCEVVGVLEVISDMPLDVGQCRIVQSVLRIYQNFQSLLDYSERDTLTGLLNRKTFDDSFLKATASLPSTVGSDNRRKVLGLQRSWLGVLDIDHFKRVNDNHGHLIGDEVLLLLSRLMRSTFRLHDRLYRFGGEEFVVMMRCADEASAAAAFERLRRNVEGYPFPQVGRITVSVGFTEVFSGDTPSAAFERADKAVYHAKENGRNQVASHAQLVARGVIESRQRDSGDVELF